MKNTDSKKGNRAPSSRMFNSGKGVKPCPDHLTFSQRKFRKKKNESYGEKKAKTSPLFQRMAAERSPKRRNAHGTRKEARGKEKTF